MAENSLTQNLVTRGDLLQFARQRVQVSRFGLHGDHVNGTALLRGQYRERLSVQQWVNQLRPRDSKFHFD